tara:strand:+ start:2006 stop:3160 length:1155 start_codon:yes stop_codon:yes gene_type:complete
MLSTDPSKVNVIIYLAKKLRNEVSESELTDPVMLRLIVILNYVVIVLFKVKGTEKSKNTPLHLNVILRLLVRLRLLSTETSQQSDFHKYLREHHPDVYKSVINKSIDPELAYEYCQIENDKCKEFSCKLQDLVTAEEYYNFENGSTTINEEQIFIRELVRIIARYKAAGVIITSLNKNIIKLKGEVNSLEQEKAELETTISGIVRLGQPTSIKALTPIPDNIEQEGIETVNVDSSGNGLTIRISGGEIFVDEHGDGYRVNDVLSFVLTLAVNTLSKINIGISQLLQYTDNSQFVSSDSENLAVTATYYIKISEIETPTVYAQEIGLDSLLFKVPIWTRMYQNIAPDVFDINMLIEIKEAIENYDVQYAILKYGSSDDRFDTSFV